jgi:transcriptional regulator with XRE-family HTH domain
MGTLTHFAVRLRYVRAAAKMTQRELADRSGVHRQTIAQLELGTREPTWYTVQLLADALGVDCSVFLDPALRKNAGQAEPTAKRKPKRKG